MLKIIVILSLCGAVLIEAMSPTNIHQRVDCESKTEAPKNRVARQSETEAPQVNLDRFRRQAPKPPKAPQFDAHQRVARQSETEAPQVNLDRMARQVPGADAAIPDGMKGGMNPGNLGMQGLGNIPDPTVWIAKGQEIASQFARGRRRRDSIPMPPMPPMPKMLQSDN